ncbi:MAG: c-type cytochrome [Hyphomicrobium sp.]|jgi:mono/diheme cytochrome c family protein
MRSSPWILKIAAILLVALGHLASLTRIAAAGSTTWTKVIEEGAEDFKESCAACHGADARGGGDLGGKLFKKPADLTTMSERNGCVFPFRRAFEILAGDGPVEGHDTMHMPKYAERMKREDFEPGYHRAHLRILELTHYLDSIQGKSERDLTFADCDRISLGIVPKS